MRKFCILSVVALTVVVASQQNASAFHNLRFKAGVDLSWTSGNNNFLWGLYRNGLPHSHPTYAPLHFHAHPMVPHHHHPVVHHPVPHHHGHAAVPAPATQQPAATPAENVPPTNVRQAYYQMGYYNHSYQPVSHYQSWGYPSSSYYNYQVPSYWYGQ